MQVQKEEVRDAIIEKAADAFFQHGFEKASIRKIAKEAGTTIGNLYNYFENKEELFYIIMKPTYDRFINFMNEHHNHQEHHEGQWINPGEIQDLLKEMINDLDRVFTRELVILIDGSKGTRYEHVREELILFLIEHLNGHLSEIAQLTNRQFQPEFSRAIASGFLDGLLSILKTVCSTEEMKTLIGQYILFYIFGIMGFAWTEKTGR
ncbi:MAG: TetR family transcriptional regulator [Anaerosolibacter sp.]|jgi:AcrR family transcriptional regulator|uniref:TetR/AcrR family transcriptional regulator n=1 Tax=Anaerosolibacter sp. TaxID=1872527 RepID=UPI0026104324|nr:TetR/AcrR family transcriptional regulator [Anaerosolibacter sp.]MDF2548746.1 TetR family transcriptional regulator [Anaerosolibacter sp.]